MAKSISAYDMAVSDAVYGKSDRYLSMGRLQAMLDHEYELNLERLDATRGHDNAFFAFADTVVARSCAGGNECHGWMGVKFQSHQRDEPSQIVLHVRMFGPDGHVLQPSEVLRKKAILVERGSFRPPTVVNIDMLACAREKFEADPVSRRSRRARADRADDGQPARRWQRRRPS